jgi:hypothetical protein
VRCYHIHVTMRGRNALSPCICDRQSAESFCDRYVHVRSERFLYTLPICHCDREREEKLSGGNIYIYIFLRPGKLPVFLLRRKEFGTTKQGRRSQRVASTAALKLKGSLAST